MEPDDSQNEEHGSSDRLGLVERDVRSHARTLTEITKSLIEQDKREAVRVETDKHLDERLDRIEASIQSVYGLGKWLLAAAGSSLVVAIIGFVIKGGLLG
jgi:hypothetical protein